MSCRLSKIIPLTLTWFLAYSKTHELLQTGSRRTICSVNAQTLLKEIRINSVKPYLNH